MELLRKIWEPFRILGFLFLISAVETGCPSTPKLANAPSPSPNPVIGNLNNPINNNNNDHNVVPPSTEQAIRTFKPALAVRAASCLVCHASIQGNIVTDFGFGNSYFLQSDSTESNGGFYSNILRYISSGARTGNYEYTWQSAHVEGSVVVPHMTLSRQPSSDPTTVVAGNTLDLVDPNRHVSSMTLKQYMQSPYQTGHATAVNGQPVYFGDGESMVTGVRPPDNQDNVIDYDNLYIGAPGIAQIESLDTSNLLMAQNTIEWAQATVTDGEPSFSGLEAQGNGAAAFFEVKNSALTCYGDVLIKGNLLMQNTTIATDDKGCRLYVTGTVWIEGDINYIGNYTKYPNLQITSAKAIVMGFNPASLAFRFYNVYTDEYLRSTPALNFVCVNFTDPSQPTAAYQAGQPQPCPNNYEAIPTSANSILQDVISMNRIEASTDTNQNWDLCTPEEMHPYQHLLLNAPQVESHYCGVFTGSIIGEIVISRLFSYTTNFNFAFDSVFEEGPMPILPLFADKVPILTIQ